MRTTVEIPEVQRRLLHAIALKRRLRGFSKVIQEAIAFYLQNKKEHQKERLELLRAKGSWSDEESDRVREEVGGVRGNWKI